MHVLAFIHYEYTPAIYIQLEFCLLPVKSKKVIGNYTSAKEIKAHVDASLEKRGGQGTLQIVHKLIIRKQ